MKKAAMLLALLGTFSLSVFAQDASKPTDGTATADTTTASPAKHAKKHVKKHHKVAKSKTADDAAKTPAESSPATK